MPKGQVHPYCTEAKGGRLMSLLAKEGPQMGFDAQGLFHLYRIEAKGGRLTSHLAKEGPREHRGK